MNRRRTLRVRLTALYVSLFMASGALLLAIAFLLLLRALPDGVLFSQGPDGAVLVGRSALGASEGEPVLHLRTRHGSPGGEGYGIHVRARDLRAQAVDQRADDLRGFLGQCTIVIAALGLLSTAVGWVVAGRALRPIRVIARRAREITANDLHARLALSGPDDELKELGDTIDGLLERLERAFRSQRQFVANASHELRTPLTRQRTLIQVALSDPDATVESLRNAHERVLFASDQQQRLLEALLTLARSEAGLDRREPIELSHLVEQVALSRRAEATQRGLKLNLRLDRASIAGDPRLWERLIANLLDNAVRHNIVSGHVDVRTSETEGRAVLSVANSGPVIAPSEIARLLQPFQRLGPTRGRTGGGLGLGLSIVQAIAVAHEATITVRPRVEGGLEVVVGCRAWPPAGSAWRASMRIAQSGGVS